MEIKIEEKVFNRHIDRCKALGMWLSAAIEDPKACLEFKNDIVNFFHSLDEIERKWKF